MKTIKNQVYSTSEAYDLMAENWALPITLMGGEKSMKEAGRTYLPQMPLETDVSYSQRLERTTLKNFFAWAVANHTGRVFNKPIVLSEETPPNIMEYNENLDLMGNDKDNFYKHVFKDTLVKGISYVYVDYPRTAEDMSYAEEMDLGFRPYCIHVRAEQVIQAVPLAINGRIILSRVHLAETISIPDGRWGSKEIEQVRVLYPGSWEIWRPQVDKKSWYLFDTGETSLDYIPLFPLYGNKTGFFTGVSPLQDLAYLNRAHWQSLSDQMNITHTARVPILFGTGYESDSDLKISSDSIITGPINSDLKYVEHTGAAIAAGMDEVKDLEERMEVESLNMIQKNNTATGSSLETSEDNSSLQDIALRLEQVITRINLCMCDWSKTKRAGKAIINTDFGLHIKDGSESNILLKARQNRSISAETLWRELKRRGVLSTDFNPTKEKKLLEKEKKENPQPVPYTNENGKQIVGDRKANDLDTGKPRVE